MAKIFVDEPGAQAITAVCDMALKGHGLGALKACNIALTSMRALPAVPKADNPEPQAKSAGEPNIIPIRQDIDKTPTDPKTQASPPAKKQDLGDEFEDRY